MIYIKIKNSIMKKVFVNQKKYWLGGKKQKKYGSIYFRSSTAGIINIVFRLWDPVQKTADLKNSNPSYTILNYWAKTYLHFIVFKIHKMC